MSQSKRSPRLLALALLAIASAFAGCQTTPPPGQSTGTAAAARIERDSRDALRQLYKSAPRAQKLGDKAVAVLVFPKIFKAGFVFGGQGGNGALFRDDNVAGYFNSIAASYGFQAGMQTFGYALFFMSDKALAHLDNSRGWELGSNPNIVIADAGMAGSLSTTTAHQGVYAFFFNQRGLMGGVGIEGSKITRIYPR